MKIIEFISDQPQTPFAPYWQYVLCEFEDVLDDSLVVELKNIILSKKDEIINSTTIGNDGNTGLGDNSLTSRHSQFNLLSWNEIQIYYLKDILLLHYQQFLEILQVKRQKTWIKCWANVMNYGQEIKEHIHATHPLTWIGGNITIACENTSTFYVNPITKEYYESVNLDGKITMFQNSIPHYTNKHLGKEKRISIGFDIILDERYNQYSNLEKENFLIFDNI